MNRKTRRKRGSIRCAKGSGKKRSRGRMRTKKNGRRICRSAFLFFIQKLSSVGEQIHWIPFLRPLHSALNRNFGEIRGLSSGVDYWGLQIWRILPKIRGRLFSTRKKRQLGRMIMAPLLLLRIYDFRVFGTIACIRTMSPWSPSDTAEFSASCPPDPLCGSFQTARFESLQFS